MKITETRLRQIIREEMEQLHLPGMEPDETAVEPGMDQLGEELMGSRLADASMEDLKPSAAAQTIRGGYITISRRDVFERWRDEWLRSDPNAAYTLQGDIYVVDPDLKRRTDREAQAIVRQKEKYGSY